MTHPILAAIGFASAGILILRKRLRTMKERLVHDGEPHDQHAAFVQPHTPPAPAETGEKLLDSHLPQSIQAAVTLAANHEVDSSKLKTFGHALLPEYPIAASILLARAALLDMAASHDARNISPAEAARTADTPSAADVVAAHSTSPSASAATLHPLDASGGFNFNPLHAIKGLAGDLGKIGVIATFIPGVGQTAVPLALAIAAASAGHSKAVQHLPVVRDVKKEADKLGKTKAFQYAGAAFDQMHPAHFAAMIASTAGQRILSGDRLDHVAMDAAKKSGAFFGERAAIASVVVPGAAPAVVAAMSAAGALAAGKSISDSAIHVAAQAVPGDNAQAVEAGAQFANHMVTSKGKDIGGATLAAAKAEYPNATSSNAFDVGMTLGLAKHLQGVNFQEAARLLPAGSTQAASAMADQVATAVHMGADKDLVDKSVAALKSQLPESAADEAHSVISRVVAEPALLRLPPAILAKRLGTSEPATRAALAAMTHEIPGAPIVSPDRLHTLVGRPRPPAPIDAGHATLALRAGQGNQSAAKQLSYQAAQNPSDANAILRAKRATSRALWSQHYLQRTRPAPPSAVRAPAPPAASSQPPPASYDPNIKPINDPGY